MKRPKTARLKPAEDRVPFGRRKDNSSFYNSRKWRKVSKAFRAANPLCVECGKEGRVGPADVADHIIGLDNILKAGGNPYSWDSLQPMCHRHHNIKSGKEAHR